jgi:hypothetical protein
MIKKSRLIRVAEKNAWKPDAVMSLTSNMGVGIKIIDGGDAVEYSYCNGDKWDEPKEAMVEYGARNDDSEPYEPEEDSGAEVTTYFVGDGKVYWIDDFVRTDSHTDY